MPRRTLKLTIAYDGTAYAGWQRQANAQSIQAVIEDEIAAIVGAHHPLNAAGRTDAGVHAAAQVASITIDHPIACDELVRALNARSRPATSASAASRRCSIGSTRASMRKPRRIDTRSGTAPRRARSSATWCGTCRRSSISIAMVEATKALVGEHDFAAFQGRSSDVLTTVRTVLSAELVEMNIHTDQPIALSPLDDGAPHADGRLLRFEITGTGFLRHMVRIIVGTLVDIGRGQLEVADMARDHRVARSRARRSNRAASRADALEGYLLGVP